MAKEENLTLEDIVEIVSEEVKGEDNLIRLITLAAFSAYTGDPLNLALKAPQSEGKSYTVTKTLEVFPQEDVIELMGATPKSFIYEEGAPADEDGEPLEPKLRELREAAKRTTDKKEKKRLMREYFELSNNPPNKIVKLENKIIVFLESPDTKFWALLRPLMSHDKKELIYKFTEKRRDHARVTRMATLYGWPAFIYASAANPRSQVWNEIESRYIVVSPRSGREKYEEVLSYIAGIYERPQSIEEMERRIVEIAKCRRYIRKIRDYLIELKFMDAPTSRAMVWVPFLAKVRKEFPKDRGQVMRDFNYFIRVIESSALFHLPMRPSVKVCNPDDSMFPSECIVLPMAVGYDLMTAARIFSSSTVYSRLPMNITKFFEEVIIPLADEQGAFAVKDIEDYIQATEEFPYSAQTIRKYMNILEEKNLVSSGRDPEDRRRLKYYVISRDTSYFAPEVVYPSCDEFVGMMNNVIDDKWRFSFDPIIKEDPAWVRMADVDWEIVYKKFFKDYHVAGDMEGLDDSDDDEDEDEEWVLMEDVIDEI